MITDYTEKIKCNSFTTEDTLVAKSMIMYLDSKGAAIVDIETDRISVCILFTYKTKIRKLLIYTSKCMFISNDTYHYSLIFPKSFSLQ